uniref:Uncharacterized protein n=1 Tax=Prolemur simus TaxID=1328070 RepID=A0A8C8YHN6_PROSS
GDMHPSNLLDSGPWSAFSHSASTLLVSFPGPSGQESHINLRVIVRLLENLGSEHPLLLRQL